MWLLVVTIGPSFVAAGKGDAVQKTLGVRVLGVDQPGPMVGVNVVVLDYRSRVRLAESRTDEQGDVDLTFPMVKKIEVRVEIPEFPFDAGPWIMKRSDYESSDIVSLGVSLSVLLQRDCGPNKTGRFRIYGTVLYKGGTPMPGAVLAIFRGKPRIGYSRFFEIGRIVAGPDGEYDVTIDVGNQVYITVVEDQIGDGWRATKGHVSKAIQKHAVSARRDLEIRKRSWGAP